MGIKRSVEKKRAIANERAKANNIHAINREINGLNLSNERKTKLRTIVNEAYRDPRRRLKLRREYENALNGIRKEMKDTKNKMKLEQRRVQNWNDTAAELKEVQSALKKTPPSKLKLAALKEKLAERYYHLKGNYTEYPPASGKDIDALRKKLEGRIMYWGTALNKKIQVLEKAEKAEKLAKK